MMPFNRMRSRDLGINPSPQAHHVLNGEPWYDETGLESFHERGRGHILTWDSTIVLALIHVFSKVCR